MLAHVSFVLSQITRLTDRRTEEETDGQTAFSLLNRVACNACSAVITGLFCRSSAVYEISISDDAEATYKTITPPT